MATIAAHRHETAGAPGWTLPGMILGFFDSLGAAHRTAAEYQRLSAKSDAALERAGLSRTDIARAAFERHFGG